MSEHVCPECGCLFEVAEKPAPRRQRSYQQLKRVMAICREAFHQWPETADFRPKNEEHLRYFLECEAGHFTVTRTTRLHDIDPDKIAPIVAGIVADSDDIKMFVEIDGALITTKKVKSVAYDALDHRDACKLFQDMEDVLHAYGLNADQLLLERGKAA